MLSLLCHGWLFLQSLRRIKGGLTRLPITSQKRGDSLSIMICMSPPLRHARFAYDKEKTDRYNERPWGVGFGQSCWDDKGNWHGLYMMAFKDSFNKWEPIGGYGWEKPATAGRR